MSNNPDTKELVVIALEDMGYDGLYNDDSDEPCGCLKDDIAPCGDMNWGGCKAGYNRPVIAKKQGFDFWISPDISEPTGN